MRKIITSLIAILVVTNLEAQQRTPKLVVCITVDQLRGDYIEYFYNTFGERGFKRLMNEGLAKVVRAVANYGSQKKYVFKYCGRNSRLDEIQAAVLGVKLKHLDEDVAIRKEFAKYYIEHITNPDIITPIVKDWDAHVFHIFTIRTKKRDELQKYLDDNGVQTIIHYPIPPHKQACYQEWNSLSFPITEQIHNEELSLPMSPVITKKEVRKVTELLNAWKD